MNQIRAHRRRLLCTAVATSLAASFAAAAQAAEPAAGAASDVLGEVVVTATRQADTVNRVPLSISAVTQATLDRQGVKTTADIARNVPGLAFRETGGDRLPQLAIRGIATQAGASTTGVYFDDTPLQQTGISGGPVTGAGTPLPQIFDLERVEVLKGPQGTLYGGSSEGGTVRFISPTPSLSRYSGYARGELSTTEHGGESYNGGVALGGPIVQDKLGFRASAYAKHIGGYVDNVSRFDGHVVAKDVDSAESQAYRAALLWRPIERLEITPSLYLSHTRVDDSSQFWANIPQYTIAARSWQANGAAATNPATAAYTLPAHTYGPYNMFGPYRNGNVTNVGDNFANGVTMKQGASPSDLRLRIASLGAEYDFGAFTGKLIGSLVSNNNKGATNASYSDTRILTNSPFLFNLPVYHNYISYNDKRRADTEELRFVSKPSDNRLSWVVGFYRNYTRQGSRAWTQWNYGDLTRAARGVSDTVFYGAPAIDPSTWWGSYRDQKVIEKEIAAYGEGTYRLAPQLKLIAGLRYSETEISYKATYYGQTLGTNIPTKANGGLTNGTKKEWPLSPKVGFSYQLADDSMIFGNIAKGYRIGGINSPAAVSKCASDLADIGLAALPETFNSDTVWSYEAGTKTRIANRVQFNSSVFYIDWKNPQTRVALPTCGTNYVINAGHAVSKGVDASLQARVVGGLSLTGQIAYTDAKYTETVGLDTPTAHPRFVMEGDRLPVPKVSWAVAAEYAFEVASMPAYIRADYQYTGKYQQGPGPGTTSYAPDTYILGRVRSGQIRAGLTVRQIELSAFVNNVFAYKDILSYGGGRASCPDAACTNPRSNNPSFTGTTLRPREFGVSAAYRF